MGVTMTSALEFRITVQTIKENWKITAILTLLFMGLTVMYSGMYPSFKDALNEMLDSGLGESFEFFRGAQYMDSYAGFLNLELYQIFWILILGIIIGFIAASYIAKEIEGKTIDLLLANPIARRQIVIERYLGLIPLLLVINVGTLAAVVGVTYAINEELNMVHLVLTHVVSIPYFLAVAGMGVLISVILDEKMKASIVMIAVLVGMFIFNSISNMVPDYETVGSISLMRYYDPTEILLNGEVDGGGAVVLLVISIVCVLIAIVYFERKDIPVT